MQNHHKIYKIIFLLFTLFIHQVEVFADENSEGLYMDTDRYKATASECLLDLTSILAIGVGVGTSISSIIAGVKSIAAGTALVALIDPTTLMQIKGAALIASGTIGIATGIAKLTYVAIGGVGFGVCFSFVTGFVIG